MPSEFATAATPLAPSVEKAYYRKCIALKRRLNEVESANNEAKLRRVRLDRAIMKMRLERAFLLDELRKRTDVNVEGSDGSGDEGIVTPVGERPLRDKRRRTGQGASSGQDRGQEDEDGGMEVEGNGTGEETGARVEPLPGNPYASASMNGGGSAADAMDAEDTIHERRVRSSHSGERAERGTRRSSGQRGSLNAVDAD